MLAEIWHRVLARQPVPAPGLVAATAVAGLLLVLPRPLWAVTRHAVTIVHEGAHGLVARLVGRRLAGIRLHSDTSGLTVSRGRSRGPGMIATFLAGYPGPALVGLGSAALLGSGHAVAVLWLVLLGLALMLLQIRNWFGLWSVLLAGSVVFAITWWTAERAQSAFAYLLTWFLLFAATRPVLELRAQRRGHRARDSDADQLARLTGVPGAAWVAVFAIVNLGALALGGSWLLAA